MTTMYKQMVITRLKDRFKLLTISQKLYLLDKSLF